MVPLQSWSSTYSSSDGWMTWPFWLSPRTIDKDYKIGLLSWAASTRILFPSASDTRSSVIVPVLKSEQASQALQ